MPHDPPPHAAAVRLRSGTLRLRVEQAEVELDALCGYASRRSRKRGFVFVSKVLGKHHPVRPARMADTYARLARKLAGLPGPAVLVALAETATGLGRGVYEAWVRATGRRDLLFTQTTRYRLRRPPALTFDESHSHATEHLLYEPADPAHADLFRRASTLVLVDDEITTGRTLAGLVAAYRRLNPRLGSVHLVCLTDWMGRDRRAELAAELGVPAGFHSLLRGDYTFDPDPAFDPGPIPDVTGAGGFKDDYLPVDFGRLGCVGLLTPDLDGMTRAAGLRPGDRVLVLGTGEFAYPPYLLARHLQTRGWDTHFQTTTRSPLMTGAALATALEFVDNYHDGIPNYVYNVVSNEYDRVLVGYETRPLPAAHVLPDALGATAVMFA